MSEGREMEWETVVGLEIHAQLATRTKIFSGSPTAYGAEAQNDDVVGVRLHRDWVRGAAAYSVGRRGCQSVACS
jgi:hypothetical protein